MLGWLVVVLVGPPLVLGAVLYAISGNFRDFVHGDDPVSVGRAFHRVVRVIPVTGALLLEGGNRAWSRDVRIEFTGPPTPERLDARVGGVDHVPAPSVGT